MGICKRVKRNDISCLKKLWNIITGHKEKNYKIINIEGDEDKCKK